MYLWNSYSAPAQFLNPLPNRVKETHLDNYYTNFISKVTWSILTSSKRKILHMLRRKKLLPIREKIDNRSRTTADPNKDSELTITNMLK